MSFNPDDIIPPSIGTNWQPRRASATGKWFWLFEAGKVGLHGRFPELEAELLGMIAGGGYEGPGISPDRADAMVWGLTELMLGREQIPPSVRQL